MKYFEFLVPDQTIETEVFHFFYLQTLSRVIGTVVHFNDEQMRKVVAREDAKTNVSI